MKIVTAAQMRAIDAAAIARGVEAAALMDRAGRAIAREALECFEPDSVAVITGKGNNAGDGFVAARELARRSLRVTVYMLATPAALRGEALAAYETMPADLERIIEPSPAVLREQLIQYDLVIDAIAGTGLKGPLRGDFAAAVEAVNACQLNVLAADIPSGLQADGAVFEPHIRAALTVTMGLPKISMTTHPGLLSTGRVVVADLGFPTDLLENEKIETNLMTAPEMRALLPARAADGHKGTFGRAMILAGGRGMTGAAILAARAGERSGAGLVFSAYPAPLGAIFETNLLEPVKIPLPGRGDFFGPGHAARVLKEAKAVQAVAVGPGIGQSAATGEFFKAVVRDIHAPLVIDADGLNLLAKNKVMLKKRKAPTVLTPHPLEAARLLGCTVDEVLQNRLEIFKDFAAEHDAVVVLKGAQTVVTAPGGQRYLNPTGNTGLAKGGSGDVLTGLICGLLAQDMAPCEAARLGVFVHGMAADLAAETQSVRSITPQDVIGCFGRAFRQLEKA